MTKPIEISHTQYKKLLEQLKKEYPPSIFLIRERMKQRLGFVFREYKDWDNTIGAYGGYRKNCMMIDFYSEKKRTWFIMKYSDYISKEYVDNDF